MMKQKNRILLQDSSSLLGVIDPFGILKENEIFVQIKLENQLSLEFKSV